MRASGTRSPSNGHLIVFYKIQLGQHSNEIELKIDEEEVNAVSWVSRRDIHKIFTYQAGETPATIIGKHQDTMVDLKEFYPTYPNQDFSGIGKAHTYALKYLYSDILDVNSTYDKATIRRHKL